METILLLVCFKKQKKNQVFLFICTKFLYLKGKFDATQVIKSISPRQQDEPLAFKVPTYFLLEYKSPTFITKNALSAYAQLKGGDLTVLIKAF